MIFQCGDSNTESAIALGKALDPVIGSAQIICHNAKGDSYSVLFLGCLIYLIRSYF